MASAAISGAGHRARDDRRGGGGRRDQHADGPPLHARPRTRRERAGSLPAHGRRHAERVEPGDTLDCWRVEVCERPRRLRLAAEMKMPGRGWLEFEVVPRDGDVTIHQTAVFDPRGLGGLAYWYAIWPLHELVFRRMLAGIARFAVRGG
ncbi:MAG: DUF2867 domain-containing protein [Planctomycetia bacterium]